MANSRGPTVSRRVNHYEDGPDMSLANALGVAIAVLLLVYLAHALWHPERY